VDERSVESPVTLPADGSELVHDFAFPPVYPVRGRVHAPSGQPIAWAHVHFRGSRPGTDRLPAPHFATVTRADGTFEIRLPAGPYEVEAWRPAFFPVRHPGLIVGDPAPEDLDLQMPPGAVLTGRLLGLPRGEAAEIEARGPLPPSGEVDEDALYRLPFGENDSGLPRGDNLPDGTYRITDLGPGTWDIVAEIPSTSVNGKKREARGRVVIPPGAVRARLDLDFGPPRR
jgi:hypothetical protein